MDLKTIYDAVILDITDYSLEGSISKSYIDDQFFKNLC